jgi:hypothetical protein
MPMANFYGGLYEQNLRLELKKIISKDIDLP